VKDGKEVERAGAPVNVKRLVNCFDRYLRAQEKYPGHKWTKKQR